MERTIKIKPNKSFRENARAFIPALYDEMMGYNHRVLMSSRFKEELHAMRIAGKKLRYAMELCNDMFGEEFEALREQIKALLERFGIIHDIDVGLPVLQDHLGYVRTYNQKVSQRSGKLSTKGLARIITGRKGQRSTLYKEVVTIIRSWEDQDMRAQLVGSMQPSVPS
jgi:CHAD domain-containing protein